LVATPLRSPAPDFDSLPLRIIEIDPTSLCRVSRHNTSEPFFGRFAASRFDDAHPDPAKRYGTCYLGLSLRVAFAESVLHDAVPNAGCYEVPVAAIDERYVLRFSGVPLRLANLTGSALNILGGNGELSGTSNYTLPRQWARAVYAHPEQVDGFLYMSRLANDGAAVVLFERDGERPPDIRMDRAIRLSHHVDFIDVLHEFNVKLTP
jgi:hypothetical protein